MLKSRLKCLAELGSCASDRYFREHWGRLQVLVDLDEPGAAVALGVVASAGVAASVEAAVVEVVAASGNDFGCCSRLAISRDTSACQGAVDSLEGGVRLFFWLSIGSMKVCK